MLDTNIVSAHFKNNPRIQEKILQVRAEGQAVFISGITYYEIKRGLLYANASAKLSKFERFCKRVPAIVPDLDILEMACKIHADLRARGRPIGDADILIAATAIARDLTLVSNDLDMLNVTEARVENWLSPAE